MLVTTQESLWATTTIVQVSGFPVTSSSNGQTTQAITTSAVGDLVICTVCNGRNNTQVCTGVSGGGVTTWNAGTVSISQPTFGVYQFWGVVTTAGAATITATFSGGSITSIPIEFFVDSYHYSGTATWGVEYNPLTTNATAQVVQLASLTPQSSPGLYWGYTTISNDPSTGSTSGFTYQETNFGNYVVSDTTGVAGNVLSPTISQASSGFYCTMGFMFSAQHVSSTNHTATLLAPQTTVSSHVNMVAYNRALQVTQATSQIASISAVIAYVQQVGASFTSTTVTSFTVPLTAVTTQGNRLILSVRGNQGHDVSSVTDTQGNTWTVDATSIVSDNVTLSMCSAYLATALTTSDSLTVTLSGSTASEAIVCEYSGIAQSGPIDVTATATNSADTTTEAISITPTLAADGVITALAFNVVTTNPTVTGATLRTFLNESGGLALADDIGAGTTAETFTWMTAANRMAVAAVAYKAAVSVLNISPRLTTQPDKMLDVSEISVPTSQRSMGRTLTVSEISVPSSQRLINKAPLTVGESSAPSIRTAVAKNLAAAETSIPIYAHALSRLLTVSVTSILTRGGGTNHPENLTVSVSSIPSIKRTMSRLLIVSESAVPSSHRSIVRSLTVAETTVPTYQRHPIRLLSVAEASNVTMMKNISKLNHLVQATNPSATKALAHFMTVIEATVPSVSADLRNYYQTFLVVQTSGISLARSASVSRHLTAAEPTIASIKRMVGAFRSTSQITLPSNYKTKQTYLNVAEVTIPILSKYAQHSIKISETTLAAITARRPLPRTLFVAESTIAQHNIGRPQHFSITQNTLPIFEKTIDSYRYASQPSSATLRRAAMPNLRTVQATVIWNTWTLTMLEGHIYIPSSMDLLYFGPEDDYLVNYPDGVLDGMLDYMLVLVEGQEPIFELPEWQYEFNSDDVPSLTADYAVTSRRDFARLK
jgi:hypothetical protein